jgi:hypothetical protein
MESEIQGLEDLTGYFVQQDKVVAIRFHPRPRRCRAIDLVERMIPVSELRPLDLETGQSSGSAWPGSTGKAETRAVEQAMNLNAYTSCSTSQNL